MPRKNPEYYAMIATWLQPDRLPGDERAFQEWLAVRREHQLEWNQWQHLMAKAKWLNPEPFDVDAAWGDLRDALGLRRSSRSHRRSSRSTAPIRQAGHLPLREFFNRPLVIAVVSMVALSIYFLILYVVRLRLGF